MASHEDKDFISMLEKEAKEAVIDRKLKEMQEKNKEIQRRHAEVEEDRRAAEKSDQPAGVDPTVHHTQEVSRDDNEFQFNERDSSSRSRGPSRRRFRARNFVFSSRGFRAPDRTTPNSASSDVVEVRNSDSVSEGKLGHESTSTEQSSTLHRGPRYPSSRGRARGTSARFVTVPDGAQSSDHRHVAAINDSLVINVDFARTSSQPYSKPASNDAPLLTKQKNEPVSGTVNTEQSTNEQTSPRNSAKQEDASEVHDEDRRIENHGSREEKFDRNNRGYQRPRGGRAFVFARRNWGGRQRGRGYAEGTTPRNYGDDEQRDNIGPRGRPWRGNFHRGSGDSRRRGSGENRRGSGENRRGQRSGARRSAATRDSESNLPVQVGSNLPEPEEDWDKECDGVKILEVSEIIEPVASSDQDKTVTGNAGDIDHTLHDLSLNGSNVESRPNAAEVDNFEKQTVSDSKSDHQLLPGVYTSLTGSSNQTSSSDQNEENSKVIGSLNDKGEDTVSQESQSAVTNGT